MPDVIEKRAPVQGYSAGIPWSMHLRAYDEYSRRYRPQQALIEGGCRGGFGTSELDMFIPGWREELSEIEKLRKQVAEMQHLLALVELAVIDVRTEGNGIGAKLAVERVIDRSLRVVKSQPMNMEAAAQEINRVQLSRDHVLRQDSLIHPIMTVSEQVDIMAKHIVPQVLLGQLVAAARAIPTGYIKSVSDRDGDWYAVKQVRMDTLKKALEDFDAAAGGQE